MFIIVNNLIVWLGFSGSLLIITRRGIPKMQIIFLNKKIIIYLELFVDIVCVIEKSESLHLVFIKNFLLLSLNMYYTFIKIL